jgi:hypothetical protein
MYAAALAMRQVQLASVGGLEGRGLPRSEPAKAFDGEPNGAGPTISGQRAYLVLEGVEGLQHAFDGALEVGRRCTLSRHD